MRIRIKVLDLPELASVFGHSDFLFSFSGENRRIFFRPYPKSMLYWGDVANFINLYR